MQATVPQQFTSTRICHFLLPLDRVTLIVLLIIEDLFERDTGWVNFYVELRDFSSSGTQSSPSGRTTALSPVSFILCSLYLLTSLLWTSALAGISFNLFNQPQITTTRAAALEWDRQPCHSTEE